MFANSSKNKHDIDLQQAVIRFCSDEEEMLSTEYLQSLGRDLATNKAMTTSLTFKGVILEDKNGMYSLIDALSSNTTLTKVTLFNVDIDDELLERIVEALSTNTTLKKLNLMKNRITNVGVEKLVSFLVNNRTLEVLKISGNDIGNKGIEELGNVLLHSNTTLRSLHVGGSSSIGEESAKSMGRMLQENRTLEELHLLGVEEGEIFHITDAMKINSTLKVLYLDLSVLTLEEMRHLGGMLSVNTTLKRLSLFDCAIETEGVEEMLRCMRSPNASLRILDIGCNAAGMEEMEKNIREKMTGLVKIKW